jgi:hypothetical protein
MLGKAAMTEAVIQTLDDYQAFEKTVCGTPVQRASFLALNLDRTPLPFSVALEWGDKQAGSRYRDVKVLVRQGLYKREP